MSRLPYATPDEAELPGREPYEVTQESRFNDPDARHLPSCPCVECHVASRLRLVPAPPPSLVPCEVDDE